MSNPNPNALPPRSPPLAAGLFGLRRPPANPPAREQGDADAVPQPRRPR